MARFRPTKTSEYSDEAGAKKLCAKLTAFWGGKGSKKFRCWPSKGLVINDWHGNAKEIYWGVESNLINGLPPDMLYGRRLAA